MPPPKNKLSLKIKMYVSLVPGTVYAVAVVATGTSWTVISSLNPFTLHTSPVSSIMRWFAPEQHVSAAESDSHDAVCPGECLGTLPDVLAFLDERVYSLFPEDIALAPLSFLRPSGYGSTSSGIIMGKHVSEQQVSKR